MDSPARLISKGPSRGPSASGSNRMKIISTEKFRRSRSIVKPKSSILHKRRTRREIDNGDDVTPKLLIHDDFDPIEENQLTALDAIGNSIHGSNTFLTVTAYVAGGLRLSSSNIVSSSIQAAALGCDEIHMDSLLSIQKVDDANFDENKAPSQFHLPRCDSDILLIKPEKVTITLKETETFFIFEMPQLTEDKRTPKGAAVLAENERYKFITVGAGSNRKLTDAETQTPQVHTKVRGTFLGRRVLCNQEIFVSNWEMHDTYQKLNSMEEKNGLLYPQSHNSRKKRGNNKPSHRFSKTETQPITLNEEDQLLHIYQNTPFREAVRIMLRILTSNLFITAQKRFTGLISQDPYDMNLQFTYSLDLLWIFSSKDLVGRDVSCFCWSYENPSVLAVGYSSCSRCPERKDGFLVIWCAKNPSYPGRNFYFDSPVSSLDWSKEKPNWLAVGFYDGSVKVIDVKSRDLLVVRQSQRKTSPSFAPHWQLQWWRKNDNFDQELIYTSNQDGRVFCYRTGEDFICKEVMKVPRIEGKIEGVKKTDHGTLYDVPISRNPGVLVLRKHPILRNIYFVGTDEGCVHRCSTNYLHQHIESFLAHDGPIYSMEFSSFCPKIFLTSGADWCARIWAEGITKPLITLSTKMAWVRCAAWCPTISTVIATIVNNEICIWDIKKKTYEPISTTILPKESTLLLIEFTKNGNQLVAADTNGVIYIYNLEGMPFPPFDQAQVLTSSIEKSLAINPDLLKQLKKLEIT